MTTISDAAGLDQLPQFSVVQFHGEALGQSKRLVWQLDEAWFAPGSNDFMYSKDFSVEAFPAVVIWTPDLT